MLYKFYRQKLSTWLMVFTALFGCKSRVAEIKSDTNQAAPANWHQLATCAVNQFLKQSSDPKLVNVSQALYFDRLDRCYAALKDKDIKGAWSNNSKVNFILGYSDICSTFTIPFIETLQKSSDAQQLIFQDISKTHRILTKFFFVLSNDVLKRKIHPAEQLAHLAGIFPDDLYRALFYVDTALHFDVDFLANGIDENQRNQRVELAKNMAPLSECKYDTQNPDPYGAIYHFWYYAGKQLQYQNNLVAQHAIWKTRFYYEVLVDREKDEFRSDFCADNAGEAFGKGIIEAMRGDITKNASSCINQNSEILSFPELYSAADFCELKLPNHPRPKKAPVFAAFSNDLNAKYCQALGTLALLSKDAEGYHLKKSNWQLVLAGKIIASGEAKLNF